MKQHPSFEIFSFIATYETKWKVRFLKESDACNKFMLVKLFGLGVGACGLKKEKEVTGSCVTVCLGAYGLKKEKEVTGSCMTDCAFVLTVQNSEGFAFCRVSLYIVTGVCQRFVSVAFFCSSYLEITA